MPKLVQEDKQFIKDFPGRKNASVGGGESFSSDGVVMQDHVEVFYVIGDPPRTEMITPGSPELGFYYILDTEKDILATVGLPILGQYSRGAWCIQRDATCVDDTARLWEVRCTFQSDVGLRVKDSAWEFYQGTGSKDPSQWIRNRLDNIKAVNEWASENITEPLIEDQQKLDTDESWTGLSTGNLIPITNVVGEPMYPDMTRAIVILNADYFIMKKEVTGEDPDWEVHDVHPAMLEADFVNRVNDKSFYGMPVGCVMCAALNITDTGLLPHYEELMPEDPTNPDTYFSPEFWHIKATFKIRFWYEYNCQDDVLVVNKYLQGWILRLLNQGNYMKQKEEPDDPASEETVMVDGHLLSRSPVRVNLSEDGFPLTELDPPIWLEFNRYPKADFDLLLPVNIRPNDPDVVLIPDNPGTPPCT